MAKIPPFFLDAVAAIGDRRDGSVTWVASAFLFGRPVRKLSDDRAEYRTYIVTNAHVLNGLENPVIRLNPIGAEPAKEFDLDRVVWMRHPDDAVDVAVAGVSFDYLHREQMQVQFFQGDNHARTLRGCQEEGVSEGDDVYLLGFPMGLVGGPRSAVIVRHGVIARITDCQAGQSRSFLVDGYVFPGNSGGPVVTRPAVSGVIGTKVPGTAVLIGIVASYVSYQDVAVSQQTGIARVVFSENSGLTNVFPVDCIEEAVRRWEELRPFPDDEGRAETRNPPAEDGMTPPEQKPIT